MNNFLRIVILLLILSATGYIGYLTFVNSSEPLFQSSNAKKEIEITFPVSEYQFYLDNENKNILLHPISNPNQTILLNNIDDFPVYSDWQVNEENTQGNFVEIISSNNTCEEVRFSFTIQHNSLLNNNTTKQSFIAALNEGNIQQALEPTDSHFCLRNVDTTSQPDQELNLSSLRKLDNTYYSRRSCTNELIDAYPPEIEYIFSMLHNVSQYANTQDNSYITQFRNDFEGYNSTSRSFIYPYIYELSRIYKILNSSNVDPVIELQILADIQKVDDIPQIYFNSDEIYNQLLESDLSNYSPPDIPEELKSGILPRLALSYLGAYNITGTEIYGQTAALFLSPMEEIFIQSRNIQPTNTISACTLLFFKLELSRSPFTFFEFEPELNAKEMFELDVNNLYMCKSYVQNVDLFIPACSLDIRNIPLT